MSLDQNRLYLFGAGGHGSVVASQWLRRKNELPGFIDENLQIGAKVGTSEVCANSLLAMKGGRLLISIGDNAKRRDVQKSAAEHGMLLETFIADPQNYWGHSVGSGTVILAGALVNQGAIIGSGVIVNSNAVVEHDCVIGDFVHISPNATVAGGVTLANNVWVGAGATILPGIKIAPDTIIGAGSVVNKTIERSGHYVGVPIRRLPE